MQMPANWKNERLTVENGEIIGHDEYSSTIAVHSLAVLPEHQGKQVGTTLMKSYIQRIKEAAIAERIVLIAHNNMVNFYENFGFENRGPSPCAFGGGGWHDMVSLSLSIYTPSSISLTNMTSRWSLWRTERNISMNLCHSALVDIVGCIFLCCHFFCLCSTVFSYVPFLRSSTLGLVLLGCFQETQKQRSSVLGYSCDD